MGIQMSVPWRELFGGGEGEWEGEDTRGVQVGVKNREVNNEEDMEVNKLVAGK